MNVDRKQVRAEAASWVARLHGPDRNAHIEQGCKRWLAESPVHAAEFEIATDVWHETSALPAELPMSARHSGAAGERGRFLRPVLLAAGMACAVLVAAVIYFDGRALSTAVGEQRSVTLDDGTRVELNTNTRLQVRYDEHARTVVLKSGEAFFDVTRRQARPFVVIAGERTITAIGTTFVVRHENDAVSVTLIEGRLAVDTPRQLPEAPRMLSTGQRLRFDAAGNALLDSPPIEKVTAWQRGQLVFENTSLREAVAEFNRYGSGRIRIAAPQLGDVPVGGVFRIGDMSSFAQAVAASHQLRAVRHGDDIILERSSAP